MVKVYHEVIKVKTTEKFQLIDITRYVEAAVEKSQVKNGIVLVFAPHATAGVVVNENESGLISDILEK
ncbi:MAG: YjbQ family protein, partial [Desulfurococcaceae archaeon]